MVWYFIIGALAAFGLMSLLWILYGSLLGRAQGGVLVCVCQGSQAENLILRYRQLRSAGFLGCPLVLVDSTLSPREQEILQRRHAGIEFCTMAQLPRRLEMENERFDG